MGMSIAPTRASSSPSFSTPAAATSKSNCLSCGQVMRACNDDKSLLLSYCAWCSPRTCTVSRLSAVVNPFRFSPLNTTRTASCSEASTTSQSSTHAAQEEGDDVTSTDWKSYTRSHFKNKMRMYAWSPPGCDSASNADSAPGNEAGRETGMEDPLTAFNGWCNYAAMQVETWLQRSAPKQGAHAQAAVRRTSNSSADVGRILHGSAQLHVKIDLLNEHLAKCRAERDFAEHQKGRMEHEDFKSLLEPGLYTDVLRAKVETIKEKSKDIMVMEHKLAEMQAELDLEKPEAGPRDRARGEEAPRGDSTEGMFTRTPSLEEISKLRSKLADMQQQKAPCEHIMGSLRRQIGALEFKESRAHKIRSNCPKDSNIMCHAVPWRRPEHEHWFAYYQHGRAFAFTQYAGEEQVQRGAKVDVPGWWFEGVPAADVKKRYEAIAVEYSAKHVFQPAGKSSPEVTAEAIRFVCPLRDFRVHDTVVVDEAFFPNTNNWAPMLKKDSKGKVLAVAPDGEARIDFGAEVGKLWVSKAQFRKMHKHVARTDRSHHCSRADGFWMPLATWNRFKSDTLKARVFGGAANPRNWYPDIDFVVPIPPICHIPETLPLSEQEEMEAEQARVDAVKTQLEGARAALDKERAAREQEMEAIRGVGMRTPGFNEMLALGIWWGANYKNGFLSVETQEDKLAELQREADALHSKMVLKRMLRQMRDACVIKCWRTWAEVVEEKKAHDRRVKQVLARFANAPLVMTFESWRDHAHEERLLRRISAQFSGSGLLLAFVTWRDHTEELREERALAQDKAAVAGEEADSWIIQ